MAVGLLAGGREGLQLTQKTPEPGLTGDDCPAFEGVFEFCTISAGGSIGASRSPGGTAWFERRG